MKNLFSLSMILMLTLAACGKKEGVKNADKNAAKKAELAALKQQQSDLTSKIAALEKQLGANDSTPKERVKFVNVAAVSPTTFTHSLDLQGSVVADDEIYINSKVLGNVTSVGIKVGDRVSAGQVVAVIDDAMLEQSMAEIQNRYSLAVDVFNKREALWKQNIGAEIDYLTAKNNKEALEKSMSSLRQTQSMYKIVSPIAGVIEEVNIKLGQTAAPGAPLAKVVNFSKLKLRADVAEAYASRVRTGNAVTVNFPDIKKEVSSKISFVGSSINLMNRTFKVDVPLKANEANVIPNMIGVLRVVDYRNDKAFVISANLIQRDAEGDFVLIGEGGRAKKARVKVGQTYNDQMEILSGLKTGDALITVGYQDLNDGDVIAVQQ
jgi:membrane fusion protein, multidrug efflux system